VPAGAAFLLMVLAIIDEEGLFLGPLHVFRDLIWSPALIWQVEEAGSRIKSGMTVRKDFAARQR